MSERLLPGTPDSSDVFLLVRSRFLLGCTRFGSPGIFGVRTRETVC